MVIINKKTIIFILLSGIISPIATNAYNPPNYNHNYSTYCTSPKTLYNGIFPVTIAKLFTHFKLYQTKKVAIKGYISSFVGGNIYIITDENGDTLAVDLGKHGGKLLHRTPFVVIGQVADNGKKVCLVADKIIWNDFNPDEEYFTYKANNSSIESPKVLLEIERDKAFYHPLPQSENKHFFVVNPGNITESDLINYVYISARVLQSGILPIGTKVYLTGRNVTTYKENIMNFWDSQIQEIKVHMNGAYIPLGQRGSFYGTIQKNEEGYYLSLECVQSIS